LSRTKFYGKIRRLAFQKLPSGKRDKINLLPLFILDKHISNVYTLGMNTAVIITKTEPQVKVRAQRVAKDLGLSLSSLINAWLRQLIKTKTVIFSAADEEPTQYLLDALRESGEDIKAGRVVSFDTADDTISYIDEIIEGEQNAKKN